MYLTMDDLAIVSTSAAHDAILTNDFQAKVPALVALIMSDLT